MTDNSHLKILINLVRIDGDVSEEERHYLVNIGKAHGFSENDVLDMLQEDHDDEIDLQMDEDAKQDLLIELVRLMKCDGKLYKEEIRYCSQIASRLGFEEGVLFDLMLHVNSANIENDYDRLKRETKKYLKHE